MKVGIESNGSLPTTWLTKIRSKFLNKLFKQTACTQTYKWEGECVDVYMRVCDCEREGEWMGILMCGFVTFNRWKSDECGTNVYDV